FLVPIATSLSVVRKKSAPSEMAGVARQMRSILFVAMTLKLFVAGRTVIELSSPAATEVTVRCAPFVSALPVTSPRSKSAKPTRPPAAEVPRQCFADWPRGGGACSKHVTVRYFLAAHKVTEEIVGWRRESRVSLRTNLTSFTL